ncbi:MAG: helix-turn-helix transcriptional regulator [Clostridia bacterium]|nr:helix-turn-helix transcriptional regulator [Clostridia bacterium]
MTIGNKIFELRSAKNLSQGDLAELLEVSRQSVSKWETDGAVPELDKLIKMCDIFGVTLDELAGRNAEEKQDPEVKREPEAKHAEKGTAFTPQKLVGCILLAASLTGIILSLIFAENEEDLYVLAPFLLAMLACAVICLCVRVHAGYWCVWAAFAPVSLLMPNIVGLPVLSVIGGSQILFYAAMAFAANRIFEPATENVSEKRTIALALAWLACIAAYAASLLIAPLSAEIAVSWFSLCFFNFAVYTAFALLITYTVRYAKAARLK